MSSAFRHVSHGGAGDTGAPRPTLVNSEGGAGSRAHEMRATVAIASSGAFQLFVNNMRVIIGQRGRMSRVRRTVLITLTLAIWTLTAAGQQQPAPGTQKPAMTPRPPVLFSEKWQLPPHTGEPNDENMRFTPAVVTNPRVEVKLYGLDAKVIRAAVHEERVGLWTGMASSPVAITLRDRNNYMDLTDAARLRWIVRTNAIHTLYPVVRLADGRLIVGDRAINTSGEYLTVEIAFSNMRWYGLDPQRVVVLTEVTNPNLRRVDEVGLATLAPGGGHGIAGSANLSHVDVFASPVPR